MKNDAIRQEKAELTARKQKITKIVVLAIIAAILAVGLVFAGIGIYRAIVKNHEYDSYSAYVKLRDNDGRDVCYAEIVIKDYGTVKVLLDATAAPQTVNNFIKLANSGFYDGLTFHRVMEDFMIQGGDPSADGTGGYYDNDGKKVTVIGEFSANGFDNDIDHIRGVISMARGNSYNSASSQFFICNATNANVSNLDGMYAAFGYVVEGMEIIDAITEDTARYGDSNGGISDKSKHAVIESINILGYKGVTPSDKNYGSDNETEEDFFN